MAVVVRGEATDGGTSGVPDRFSVAIATVDGERSYASGNVTATNGNLLV